MRERWRLCRAGTRRREGHSGFACRQAIAPPPSKEVAAGSGRWQRASGRTSIGTRLLSCSRWVRIEVTLGSRKAPRNWPQQILWVLRNSHQREVASCWGIEAGLRVRWQHCKVRRHTFQSCLQIQAATSQKAPALQVLEREFPFFLERGPVKGSHRFFQFAAPSDVSFLS